MNLFLLFAVMMLAVAVLFVLLPLMKAAGRRPPSREASAEAAYRTQFAELEADLDAGVLDSAQYETSRRELEIRMREELAAAAADVKPDASRFENPAALARLALVLGLALPVAAAGLYAWLGKPEAINNSPSPMQVATAGNPANGAPAGAPHDVSDVQIRAMVMKLAERLKQNPNDLEGWFMLGRSMATLGQFPQALKAYEQAMKIAPNEPQVLADYADVLANLNNGNLEGKPLEYLRKALAADPKNVKALALSGEAAYRRNDFDKAIEYWTLQKSVMASAGAPPERISLVERSINDARAGKGLPALPTSAPEAPAAAGQPPFMAQMQAGQGQEAPAAAPGQTITVKVAISPKLAAKVNPGDTLFIFARAPGAAGMPPLAVIRTTASELPKTYTLDDSLAMAPMFKLSGFPEANIGARISKSGTATPQSGDLGGTIGPIKLGTHGLDLVIDTVTP